MHAAPPHASTVPPVPRFNVLGVAISALTLERARDLILDACRAPHAILPASRPPARYICLAGVHGLGEAHDDPALRHVFNAAWLATPDGMPLVWIGKLLQREPLTRVYGPDLMLAVCDAGRIQNLRHYFFGGPPGLAEELRDRLVTRFPGLTVVGTFTPPFRPLDPAETAALRADIARTQPHLVWVGLSTPKQERFMAEFAAQLDTRVLIGVGAAFDFLAGTKPQAPRLLQRTGLEWLYRLATEPRRLAPRYLRHVPLFLGRVFLQLTRLRRYPAYSES